MGIRTAVKQVLIAQQDKKYEKELAQLKVTYEQWAAEQDRESAEPREIAGLVEFIIFRQAAGRLADNATERINAYFAKHPEAEIVYGDEDLMNERGERCIPWYKPCWSPDLYRAFFYVGSVVAVRSSLLQRMGENPVVTENESTGKEILFTDAGEIRPLMGRLFLGAGGFERDCHSIGHMETVLFHGTFSADGIGIQGPDARADRDSRECTPWENYLSLIHISEPTRPY